MKKKIAVAFVLLALCAAMIGAGTFAYFSDTQTSYANSFTAGTLKIQAGTTSWSTGFNNMKPGDTVTFTIPVQSTGSLPLNYTVDAKLSGDLVAGNNPCTAVVKIDGTAATADSLSAAGGDDDKDTITVEVTMPAAAGNEYQGKSGKLDVTINAVQQ